MFEVGQNPILTWQAPIASLLSTSHDQIRRRSRRDHDDEAQNAPGNEPHASVPALDGARGAPAFGRRWRVRAALMLSVGLIIAGIGSAAMTDGGRTLRQWLAGPADVDAVASALGFGIDQVSLAGHKFTFDREIFEALDLANVRSFASLDAGAAKQRIERLPWVSTAELTRVYPNRLDIRIRERAPYAVWARGDKTYLIDDTGRVLSAVSGALPPNLPRVAGEGAALEIRAFLELIQRFPAIKKRFDSAQRVGERRWTLKLVDGVTLELPADGEAQVLDDIARGGELMRAIERGNATLDFRAPGRVAFRKTDAPVPGPKPEPRS